MLFPQTSFLCSSFTNELIFSIVITGPVAFISGPIRLPADSINDPSNSAYMGNTGHHSYKRTVCGPPHMTHVHLLFHHLQ